MAELIWKTAELRLLETRSRRTIRKQTEKHKETTKGQKRQKTRRTQRDSSGPTTEGFRADSVDITGSSYWLPELSINSEAGWQAAGVLQVRVHGNQRAAGWWTAQLMFSGNKAATAGKRPKQNRSKLDHRSLTRRPGLRQKPSQPHRTSTAKRFPDLEQTEQKRVTEVFSPWVQDQNRTWAEPEQNLARTWAVSECADGGRRLRNNILRRTWSDDAGQPVELCSVRNPTFRTFRTWKVLIKLWRWTHPAAAGGTLGPPAEAGQMFGMPAERVRTWGIRSSRPGWTQRFSCQRGICSGAPPPHKNTFMDRWQPATSRNVRGPKAWWEKSHRSENVPSNQSGAEKQQ